MIHQANTSSNIMTTRADYISNIKATQRNGQIFITWSENNIPDDALIAVFQSNIPITNDTLKDATLLTDALQKGSARDWWKDYHSFFPNRPYPEPYVPTGFVIEDNGTPLPPDSGLHVHTVTPQTEGKSFFAVTLKGSNEIIPDKNATTEPVDAKVEATNPIWFGSTPAPKQDAYKGMPLEIRLHGRGGANDPLANYVYFADDTQGWREGLPFDFIFSPEQNKVVIYLLDRVWVNRPVNESPDQRDHCNAVNTFWLGYNVNIGKTTLTKEVIVDNYTEKLILAIVKWAQRYLGTDVNRTYVSGSSMGGTAAVALSTHFPEVFAAAHAMVPIYRFTWEGCKTGIWLTADRLVCACGPLKSSPGKLVDGRDLFTYMDASTNIAVKEDMPPIFATNGRSDNSIPWNNNPAFYKAANDARQSFALFWNNGDHKMSSTVPDDAQQWGEEIFNYALNKSYPVFTNCSNNKDYGNGDPEVGDIVGWINRGFHWELVSDEKNSYAIKLSADYPGIQFPMTTDVTIRRRQNFKPAKGTKLLVDVNGAISDITMPEDGILTIQNISFLSSKPIILRISVGK